MQGKKTANNFIYGVIAQIVSIAIGVILPRLFLVNYGSEVNGLLTSVTQIYAYVALVEAGVGTAALQALYGTVAKNDKSASNSILVAVDHYYKRIGIVYFFCIIVFAAIYPFVVASEIPATVVVLVIVFNGLGNVANFFFQGKYMLLLKAEGKNYIITNLNTIISVAKNIAKIFLISAGYNIVYVQIAAFFVSLTQLIYICLYIKKNYAWIDLTYPPNYTAISQSKNVLVHQVSGLIFNNTDSIILSFACGLQTVSVYSLYTTMFTMIGTFLNTVTDSIVFVLGQKYHSDRARYVELLDAYEIYYMALTFALYTVAGNCILPFMRLYTSGITDINYIDFKLPILFISTFLLSCGRKSSNLTINFAEHFKRTQNRSILEAAINIIVSLVCVFKLGIYGVLIGTIAALLYRTNDMIIYANTVILKRSPLKTYRRWLANLGTFLCLSFALEKLQCNITLDSYFSIIIWAVLSCVVVVPLFFVIASITDIKTFHFTKQVLKSQFLRVFKKKQVSAS